MLNEVIKNVSKIPPLDKLSALSNYFGLSEVFENSSDTFEEAQKLIERSTDGAESLSNYLSYRYFDLEKELFFNDNDNIGFILEVSPIVGVDEGLLKNLRYFFNDEIPSNCFLQFLLIASCNVESIIDNWQKARDSDNAILCKLAKKRAEFIRERANDFSKYDGRNARDYQIYISFSQKLSLTSANIAAIMLVKEKLLKKLDTLKLNPKICVAENLIKIVRELVEINPNVPIVNTTNTNTDVLERTIKYDPINLLCDQILQPLKERIIEDDRIIHPDNGMVSRAYYAKELPREFSLSNMLGLLGSSENNSLGIPARFVINYTVSSDLSKSNQKALTGQGDRIIHASEQWYSRNDRDLKRDAVEWRDLNDRSKNGEQFLTEYFNVMISAPQEHIEVAEQALISLYNILDFRLEINKNLQLLSLLSILPMQQEIYWGTLKKFKLTRTCISEEIIARLPIHAEWKGVPKSGILLHARRGQLFNWNPFYRISSGNYNVSVFGPSGGGKSVFLQELVVSMISQGVRAFVLDIGQSFANICNLIDGEIIQFGKRANLSLNPFASFYPTMNEDDRQEFLKCAKALLSIMCGIKEDDPHGSAELEKAIGKALIQSSYKLDITSFAQFLESSDSEVLKRYGATLYSYTKDGLYGKYFSGAKNATFKALMTIFEFEEIKNDPKLLSIVLQILLMEITNQFLTGDRTKQFMIIVDEAWMLIDFIASFFAAFGRTVRKYGGSLVICVQNFMDLQKTQDHKAILENSTWTVMLKQDEKGLDAFKSNEAFKDMLPLIQSISLNPGKYSELLLYSTGVKVVGRLVLDDYSKVLYSTDADDFKYINEATKNGKTLDEAIEGLAIMKYGTK